MNKNVMIDTETLGVFADSVIMSIGAVKFNLETGTIEDDPFYVSISIDSNTVQGRRIQEDTLIWWLGQSAEAQAVFHEPKVILPDALEQLSDWVGPDEYEVWSNGADFDIPLLAHAFHTNDMHAPWKFYNTRCFRTRKNAPGVPKATTKPKVAHNALSDAIAQAEHLIAIHKYLTEGALRMAA